MFRMVGGIGLILFLGIGIAEAFSYVVASHLLTTYAGNIFGTSGVETILPIIVIQIAIMVIGVMIAKRSVARLPTALMGSLVGKSDALGRLAVGFVGAILLIAPGFFLDIPGLLLLLPPIQRLCAGLGQRVMMSLMKRQMAKMGLGSGVPGGFPGGFPGGGPFPGMQQHTPLQPDDRVRTAPRVGRVVDVEAERIDPKK